MMSITTDFARKTPPRTNELSPQAARLIVFCGLLAFWVALALTVTAIA